MIRRKMLAVAAACAALAGAPVTALAAKPPANWDGLVRVPSKRLSYVYLAPDADFRAYTKVMLDPVQVAFHKDWRRDYNRGNRSPSNRVSEDQIQNAVDKGVKTAGDIFAEALTKGGYTLTTEPGPDVLRLSVAVVNLTVTAPDLPKAGRTYNFAGEAGGATLVVEARDSTSGALMGRAADARVAGDNSSALRNSVTNRADFRLLVKSWAQTSVKGLDQLKARSPINAQGQAEK